MEPFYYKSPVGALEIICENNKLISLKLVEKAGLSPKETDFEKNIKSQLEEFFAGKRRTFDISINPKGTDFQKKVWKELLKIPYGKTKSYSGIAAALKSPSAQRAVGSACNKNPIMIVIPCHRVISKNGNLGGFAYGNSVKLKLLGMENSYSMSKSK